MNEYMSHVSKVNSVVDMSQLVQWYVLPGRPVELRESVDPSAAKKTIS